MKPPDQLTVAFVRANFLRGLKLVDPNGVPLKDEVIQGRINSVCAHFERKYAVSLTPIVVKCGSRAIDGEPAFDETNRHEGFDLNPDGARDNRHHIMKLPIGPVTQVHKLALWLPGMGKPATFPADWVHPSGPRSHAIRVYPGREFAVTLQMAGWWAALVSSGKPVPMAWHVTYTAGYTDKDFQGRDADVLEALGKLVTLDVLTPGGIDANLDLGLGGKSASVDGLSQSTQFLANAQAMKYNPLTLAYQAEYKEWERTFWARRSGVRLIG